MDRKLIKKQWKEESKERRNRNFHNAIEIMEAQNIDFKITNGDNSRHTIVNNDGELIDYWPSTGLFVSRETNFRSRGVNNLMKYMSGENCYEEKIR